jgi:hypothetical protein
MLTLVNSGPNGLIKPASGVNVMTTIFGKNQWFLYIKPGSYFGKNNVF